MNAAMNLAVDLAPHHKADLRLRNPIMTGAEVSGVGVELAAHEDIDALGAIVTRPISPRPQRGHALPRIAASPAGVLRSTGTPNPGVGTVVRQFAPIWARWTVPVVVAVAGNPGEVARVAARLDGVAGIAAIEVHVPIGTPPIEVVELVREAATASALPIIAKLAPGTGNVRRLVEAAEQGGAQAITISGDLPGMAIDVTQRRSALASTFATLSGPAVRPVAMRAAYLAATATALPIVAAGGITTGEDVAAFLMAGASAVQVGSAILRDPGAPWRILREFEAWCSAEGIGTLDEIRGAAQRRPS